MTTLSPWHNEVFHSLWPNLREDRCCKNQAMAQSEFSFLRKQMFVCGRGVVLQKVLVSSTGNPKNADTTLREMRLKLIYNKLNDLTPH